MKTLLINEPDYYYINTIQEYSSSFKKYSQSLDITSISLESLIYNIKKNLKFKNITSVGCVTTIADNLSELLPQLMYDVTFENVNFLTENNKLIEININNSIFLSNNKNFNNLSNCGHIILTEYETGTAIKNYRFYIDKISNNTIYIKDYLQEINDKMPTNNNKKWDIKFYKDIKEKYEYINLDDYKSIIFMYTINYILLNNQTQLIKQYIKEQFYKIYVVQDEYQYTNIKGNILKDLNIDLCFVNVNELDAPIIFNNNFTTFKTVLTGYVPDINYKKKLIIDRKMHTFYRATPLPYILGDLGQVKVNIGKYMKKIGLQNNINVDIEWEMDKKIFGEKWYEMLINSKTTLATECGCKVFDWEPRNTKINNILQENPDYTYEEAKKYFKIEPMFESCQVSPKMFESVKLGTVLIMYEGKYKGIFKPNIHYIELNKDHSNIESVIEKIKDDVYLQNMADRAYTDIIENSNYTYKDFIEYFDSVVKEKYKLHK